MTVLLSTGSQCIFARQTRGTAPYAFPSRSDSARPYSGQVSVWLLVRGRGRVRRRASARLPQLVCEPSATEMRTRVGHGRQLGPCKISMRLHYPHARDCDFETAGEWVGAAIPALLHVSNCQ